MSSLQYILGKQRVLYIFERVRRRNIQRVVLYMVIDFQMSKYKEKRAYEYARLVLILLIKFARLRPL